MTGEQLVAEVSSLLKRYVVFASDDQVLALALWVIHTYASEAADATPYILITSPEKRSGKSRLLEVLELIVAGGWRVAGVSEAVLFRKIASRRVTLLLDELDAIFGSYVEKTEPIRGVINAGSRRGGSISRCVGPHHEVEDFEVFCPKCLAGIDSGKLPDTIRDRSIQVGLHRKLDEHIERFKFSRVYRESEKLTPELEDWAAEHLEELRDSDPEVPEELNDRSAEGWEPLLAIADQIGGDLPRSAREAAIRLSGTEDLEEASFGAQLLADIRYVFIGPEAALSSVSICTALKQLEDRPWASWGRGRPSPGFNPRDLAKTLRPYGIRPKTVRVSGGPGIGPGMQSSQTAKGYQRSQFEDAWRRYAPNSLGDE